MNSSEQGNGTIIPNLDNTLVSWWRMDDLNSSGGVLDYMGRNNGTNYGATQTGNGKFGDAMSFDGSDYLQIPSIKISNFSSTVSFWAKPSSQTAKSQGILSSGSGGSYGPYIIILTNSDPVAIQSRDDGSNVRQLGSVSRPAILETWHQYTLVYNSSNVAFYFDGNLNAITASQPNNLTPLFIGAGYSLGESAGARMNGSLDDVMIFNRSLTPQEIVGIYNATRVQQNVIYLGEGQHTFVSYVQDLAGNVNLNTTNFTVDTIAPNITQVITINQSGVVSGTVVRGENVTINATVSGISNGTGNVWVKIWQGLVGSSAIVWQGFLNWISGNLWSIVVPTNSSFSLGDVNYTIYANDSAGNEINFSSNFSMVQGLELSQCAILDKPNKIYSQSANIVPTGNIASCINITASNITYDCNGKSIINTTFAKPGIYAGKDLVNITVKNCNVTVGPSSYGIYFNSVNDSFISNNIANTNAYGIYLLSGLNNKIINNNVSLNSYGIYLSGSNNSLISNNRASNNSCGLFCSVYGIYLYSSLNNSITNNTADSNTHLAGPASGYGIYLSISNNNQVINNSANYNYDGGIYISSSLNNLLINNTILFSNLYGIYLYSGSYNIFKQNNMTNNLYNFYVSGSNDTHFNNTIDTTNVVDGNSKIYYNYSVNNKDFGTLGDAGTVICAKCNNVSYRNMNLSHSNYFGLYFFNTTNSSVTNISSRSNSMGIYLTFSNFNNFTNLFLSNNSYGIYSTYSSNNIIQDSNLSLNINYEVYFSASSNNTLTNCSYNSSKDYSPTGSQLIRNWYYRAYVNTSNSIPVSNANVTGFDKIGIKNFVISTNNSGWTNRTEITEYVYDGYKNYYSNYSITASNSSYSSIGERVYNATVYENNFNDVITIDTIYPNVTIYSPVNSSYYNTSSPLFNVSSSETGTGTIVPSLDNSLISWWRMDDISGNNLIDYMGRNNGTISGAIQVDNGKFGRGMYFDGGSDYVNILDSSKIEPSDTITIAAWIKPVSGTTNLIDRYGINWSDFNEWNSPGGLISWDSSENALKVVDYRNTYLNDKINIDTTNGYYLEYDLKQVRGTSQLSYSGTHSYDSAGTMLPGHPGSYDYFVDSGTSYTNNTWTSRRNNAISGAPKTGESSTVGNVGAWHTGTSSATVMFLFNYNAAGQTTYLRNLKFYEKETGISKRDSYELAFSNSSFSGKINRNRISYKLTNPDWNYVVITYDRNLASNQQKLYLNGVLVNQSTFNEVINATNSNLTFYLNGTLDDVMIYNRSLSSQEILGIYNATKVLHNNVSTTDGNHTFTEYVQDIAGNINLSTNTFSIDTDFPDVNIISPSNGSYYNTMTPLFNINSSEQGTGSIIPNLDDSLISWWRMDDLNSTGGVLDYMGRNNGTNNGAISVDNGKFGDAMSFNGTSSVNLGNIDFTSIQNQGTVSSWIYNNQLKTYGGILTKSSGGSASSVYLDLGHYTSNSYTLFMGNGSNYGTVSVTNTNTNVWVLVTGTWNSSSLCIYLNGIFIRCNANSYPFINHNNNLMIGALFGSPTAYGLNGTIDDVMIFNRSLTSQEVLGLYNATRVQHNSINLAEGNHTLVAYAEDIAGNIGTNTSTFTIDLTAPNITQVIVINQSGVVSGTVIRGDNITINATVSGISNGTGNVWVKIWKGVVGSSAIVWQGFLNWISGNLWSIVVPTNSSFSLGDVNYTIYANDTAGNEVNFSSNFTIIDYVNVTQCRILDQPNTAYTQSADIIPTGNINSCINITASNIIYDCNGKWIANSTLAVPAIYASSSNGLTNVTIKNCNVSMNYSDPGYGIALVNVNNSYVLNNTANLNWIGIYLLSSSNNQILNNTANSNRAGISINSNSFNNLVNNNTFSLNVFGLILVTSNNNNLINNNIRNCTSSNYNQACIIVSGSSSNVFSGGTINSSLSNLIYFISSSSNNLFKDLVLSGSTFNDTYLDSGSGNNINNTFLNVTYNISRENVGAGSQLVRNWYYRAYVNDTKGTVVGNANISAYNRTNALMFGSLFTDLSGFTNITIITDYVNTGGIRSYYSNYVINATTSNYATASHTYNVTLLQNGNLKDVFTLTQINPQINFTSPTPSNATITSNSSIPINVSITQGTGQINEVRFTWNLTNYTIYNDSLILMMNFDNVSSLGESSATNFSADISRYGNNGTCSGMGAGCSYTTGRYGKAMNFDGVNDYIDITNTGYLNNIGNLTLCSWVNLNSVGSTNDIDDGGIFTKDDSGANSVLLWYNVNSVGSADHTYSFNVGNTGDLSNRVNGPTNLAIANQWQFVCGVMGGSYRGLYVDGILRASANSASATTTGTVPNNARVGGWGLTTNFLFNGTIDEVRVWNRTLSSDEVYEQYTSNLAKFNQTQWYLQINQSNNATNGLIDGTYTYLASAKDFAGSWNSTETRTVTILSNNQPNTPIVFINSTDGSNQTHANLSCFATITDPNNNAMNVTVIWYKNNITNTTLNYNNNYANGTLFISTLTNSNLSKGNNWSCGFRLYDSQAYSNWSNSTHILIINTLPTVSLAFPADGNVTTNRTPTFTWMGSDDDSDPLQYELNMTLIANSLCTDPVNRYKDKTVILGNTSYTTSPYLKCLLDNGDSYNWSVRAYDGQAYSSWTKARNISVQSLISVSLPVNSINFGNMNLLQGSNTTLGNPAPFILRNDGNAEINITANFTNLWTSVANPSRYYQFKVTNKTIGCFNYVNTTTAWTNATQLSVTKQIIQNMNFTSGYQSGCNNVSIDIAIEVPASEGAGNKSSTVTFTSYLAENYGAKS
ncbi:Concanavalin A-like lectin/glucanases superfamily protein [uncultured archaeon]|nr:Concanavalin A-like lectin/glucanases superfamily protein [uncultured archaeon]